MGRAEVEKGKARAISAVGEVDPVEMAIRIIEAQTGLPRPPGMTNEQVMGVTEPFVRAAAMRAADACIRMMAEAINSAEPVQ